MNLAPPVPQGWRAVPRSVIALGFVAMLMDMSSELIHSLLPLFLVGSLGCCQSNRSSSPIDALIPY
jgi:hypothetical protein